MSEPAASARPGTADRQGGRVTRGRERPSIFGLLNILLRYRLLIIGVPVIVAAYVVAGRVMGGSTYIATSRFVAEGGGTDASRFSGLASQLGVNLPKANGESLEFYAQLVTSQDLLRDVVLTTYPDSAGSSGAGAGHTLLDIYGIPAGDNDERILRGVAQLRRTITVTPDDKANVITVVASAKRPGLAVAINRRILELINTFNLRKRQSKAAAERTFVEGRVAAAQGELAASETALKSFLETNRQFKGSPELTVEEARLQRRVELRQQVFTTLSQAYEQARIEEVRNTPVVTVLDRPEGSARRNNRLLIKLLLALAPALVLALSLAVAHDYMVRERNEDPEGYARFRTLRRGLLRRSPSGSDKFDGSA
ncbi:MAG: hypothetical protein ABJE47_06380 [bacterium]